MRENDEGHNKRGEEAQRKAKKCRHGRGVCEGQSRRRADNEENIRETKRVPHLIYQARTRSQKQQNESKGGYHNVTPTAQNREGKRQLLVFIKPEEIEAYEAN